LSLSARGALLEQHFAKIIGILTNWDDTTLVTLLGGGGMVVAVRYM
jgi:hypothetical protein